MLPITPTVVKPRQWGSFIPIVLVAIVYGIVATQKPSNDANLVFGIVFILMFLLLFLFRKTSISIDNEGITSTNAFRIKQVLWKDITKTYLKYQHHGKSGSVYWLFETGTARSFKFSTSFYSRKSLRTIAEAVITKCSGAEIQDKIIRMSEGRFPWYIF